MRRLLRWYGVPAGCVAAYYAALILVGLEPADPLSSTIAVSAMIAGVFLGAWLIVLFYRTAYRHRSARELAGALWAELRTPENIERIITLPLLVLLSAVMFDAFSAWKQSITGYIWDPLLADLDHVFALGIDPWRVTHLLFGWATPLIDWWYVWAWWSVKLGLLVAIFTWDRLDRRARYLTAHVLLWPLAGTLLAHFLASGGPAYYEAFTGDASRFAELWRPDTPNFDRVRAMLWTAYSDPNVTTSSAGISAMPSLHVGASTLAALWGWSVGKWPGILLTGWTVLTFIGSVHLGWHYAIDGYAGALCAWGVWWLAGKVIGSATVRGS